MLKNQIYREEHFLSDDSLPIVAVIVCVSFGKLSFYGLSIYKVDYVAF